MRKRNTGISDEVLCAEYEAVFRYVLSLSCNEAEAADVTQEAFLQAMKSADSYQGASSLYTWLCAIAKNTWLNRCKKLGRELPSDESASTADASAASPEQRILEKDMSMQIHRVLHTMAEPYKEVFTLRVFGQLSFAEIAGLFSKTESWARVTFHRARRTICEQLRKEGLL